MTSRTASVFFIFQVLLFSCKGKDTDVPSNSEQFDLAHSDPAAVELADSVLFASGGKEMWDNIQSLTWTSSRGDFAWDKQHGRVRYKPSSSTKVYLINLQSGQGRVSQDGAEITNAGDVANDIRDALAEWEKESLELALPFLLKSPGASLEYLGEDTLANGAKCNLLKLNVKGKNNAKSKYIAYVDLNDNLIKKLSYFPSPDQEQAEYSQTWDNYKPYGRLLLSTDRSDGSGPRQLAVKETVDEKVFTEL